MTTSTIPLSKGFNEKKLVFPGYLSIKYDGVPARLDVVFTDSGPTYATRTRQGNELLSCEANVHALIDGLCRSGVMRSGKHTFVGELTHRTLNGFKDVGGVVRRQSPQEGLVWNIFDYAPAGAPAPFAVRTGVLDYVFSHFTSNMVRKVYQYAVRDKAHFDQVRANLLVLNPDCEGLVYRAANDLWVPASRSWGFQKIVVRPSMDLRIVGFEEAVCGKTGAGKGMVGRVIAEYKGADIGVGPGKLTHKERTDLWNLYNVCNKVRFDLIATVEYKRSPDYTALREPTFQHWRLEKTEPSYE